MSLRVIAKGNYAHRQIARFPAVKQYLITEEDGARFLYLRFVNGMRSSVTSFKAEIAQLDGEGRELCRTEYVCEGHTVRAGGEIGPLERLPVGKKCEDVRVEMRSVRSHDYEYIVEQTGVKVRYRARREKAPSPAGKRSVTSGVRRIAAAAVAAVLLFAAVLCAFSLFRALGREEGEARAEESRLC